MEVRHKLCRMQRSVMDTIYAALTAIVLIELLDQPSHGLVRALDTPHSVYGHPDEKASSLTSPKSEYLYLITEEVQDQYG